MNAAFSKDAEAAQNRITFLNSTMKQEGTNKDSSGSLLLKNDNELSKEEFAGVSYETRKDTGG